MLDLPDMEIVRKDRLQPGRMLLVDTVQGRIISDHELKETYAARQPYGEWLDRNLIHLRDLPIPNRRVERRSHQDLVRLRTAFGYTNEDITSTILPMAETGGGAHCRHGRGHSPGCAGSQRPAPVQLLQAALRPGDQPAHRRHPGGSGHRHHRVCGRRRQPAQENADNCRVLQIHNPILTSTDR